MTKFEQGTLAAQLAEQAASTMPIEPAEEGKKRAAKVNKVQATGCGTSRVQEGSKRAKVLAWISAQPEKTATIEQIEAALSLNPRGYVQKLLEVGHLEIVP